MTVKTQSRRAIRKINHNCCLKRLLLSADPKHLTLAKLLSFYIYFLIKCYNLIFENAVYVRDLSIEFDWGGLCPGYLLHWKELKAQVKVLW